MRFEPRSAVAVLVMVIAAAIAALAVRPGMPPRETRPVPAGPGRLAINAYPWATVSGIRSVDTGAAVELDGPVVTPAAPIDLPPGRYEVTLSNPRFERPVRRTVVVAPRRRAILDVEFAEAAHTKEPMIGDLDATERELSSMLLAQPSGQTYLLRGCTRYTRAVLSTAPPDLAAARADFTAALKLDAELQLDDAIFSPKLIAFFEEVRRGG